MILLSTPRELKVQADTILRWAYLGTSIRTMRRFSQRLGPEARRIEIAEMLQESAKTLRQPFLDYIGKLGVEAPSVDWWFGSLSEKNPGISPAFLNVCYVAVAAQLGHRQDGTLLLVVESPEVLSAIALYFRESGVAFAAGSVSPGATDTFRDWSNMLVRKAWGIGRQLYRMAAARMLGFSGVVFNGAAAGGNAPWVLLHNWVDSRSFGADGQYVDVFFGSLRDKLQERKLPVAVVASVLYKAPYLRLLLRLKGTGIPVLVPQAALTLGGLLRWARSLLTRSPGPHAWPRFEQFDVSDIMNAVERADWTGTRAGDVALIDDIAREWRRHQGLSAFIYTYEGHTWERGYCRAIRQHFPDAALIGYQHSTISPMHLSHFISKQEWGRVPFPDRIVTNGAHHYELLRSSGIPERTLACGGAIRYGTLGNGPSAAYPGRPDRSKVRVLATCSIFPSQAAELLLAVLEAFPDPSGFQVLIKCHPNLPARRVAREAGLSTQSLPAHIRFVDSPLSLLMSDIDVLVYTDTTSAVEALAHGVPVVHVTSGYTIDLDRLGSFDGARPSATTAAELRSAVERVMKAGADEQMSRRRREVVDALLPPPDEKTVELFMPFERRPG